MTAAVETPMNLKELLLQSGRGRSPIALELFVRLENAGESHFYARGVGLSEFATLFAADIRPLQVLIYRMPPDLLNPNYWEPLTKEGENAVREKMTGLVTRNEGDRTLLWRSDRVARSRLLQDGIDAAVELHQGYVFRTTGEGLLALAAAWNGRGRFEWTGLSLPGPDLPPEALMVCHTDLAQMGRTLPEESMLFSAADDGAVRVIFSRRDHLRRAVGALIRGFAYGVTRTLYAPLASKACDQLAGLADGVGLTASPDADVVDKGRTVEVTARFGRTRWGIHHSPNTPALVGDEKALFYYDRISGIWAIAH